MDLLDGDEKLARMLTKPWPRERFYWKHAYRGNCQELMFMSPMKKVPEFVHTVVELVKGYDVWMGDVGIYIQPVEDMRACQIDFMFHYNPENRGEVELVRKIYREAVLRVVELGGFFNRVYDGIGETVYSLPRTQGYVNYIRRVKKLFDPNAILSPGKLCF